MIDDIMMINVNDVLLFIVPCSLFMINDDNDVLQSQKTNTELVYQQLHPANWVAPSTQAPTHRTGTHRQ